MSEKVCAILGVGPGNGMACARKFLDAGYSVAVCSRNGYRMVEAAGQLGEAARGYAIDVTSEASVADGLAMIAEELGPVDTVVYNAGNANWGGVDALSAADMMPGFDVNVAGLVRTVQAVLPGMREAGSGNIMVIGASSAWRGRPGTLAFAAAKAAQRSAAQSLARQLGPEGIHVSFLVLDGVIDLETTMSRMSDKDRSFFLTADGVADAVLALVSQDRQAWTFELDLRPFGESW